MKAAIIGTGWIAGTHAQALREAGVALCAVVDENADRAAAFAREWGVAQHGTDAALAYAADCVHICTPPMSHFALIGDLLSHGKHVLCEKPLCLSDEEAVQLAALARASGLVCAVGFNVRAYLACRKAKELAADPAFGRVLLIHGSYLQSFGASPIQWGWRQQQSMYAVTEIGSHWLDLAQHLSGAQVKEISAQLDRFHQERYAKDGLVHNQPVDGAQPVAAPAEDFALMSLRFANGAMGSVVLSEASHGRSNRLSIEIVGEHRTLWWMSEEPGKLFLGTGKTEPQVLHFEDAFEKTFARVIQSVYAAIGGRSGERLFATFDEAKTNVLLCNAALRSAEQNAAWMEV